MQPRDGRVDKLAYRLNTWKRQLIDLSRRNRLLNYKATSRSTIQVYDELPHVVFSDLLNGKKFKFDPVPEPDDAADEPSTVDRELVSGKPLAIGDPGEVAAHHADDRLQTRLSKERLEGNLLAIFRRAAESIEEQGVNTLFLALGMIEWYEASSSDVKNLAPVILVPVQLSRPTAASDYVLTRVDEEPVLNPALVQHLRMNFSIDLPELPELVEDMNTHEVFESVQEAIKGFERWSMNSDIALGLFSFQKFLMYKDLEKHEDKFLSHPLLMRLAQSSDEERANHAGGLPSEIEQADLDSAMAPWAAVQVLDSDSSQQRALLAVRREHDLVIEGPPGTGKSQTIANLIADAIAEGRSVLFVSEKMAALEVVKSRIEAVGLGHSCLELHSRKIAKREFVQRLATALDADERGFGAAEGDSARLQSVTNDLRGYVIALHEPESPLGISPYEAISELAAVNDRPIVQTDLQGSAQSSSEDLSRSRRLLQRLAETMESVGDPRTHPLRGFRVRPTGRGDIQALDSAVKETRASLATLSEVSQKHSQVFGLNPAKTMGNLRASHVAANVISDSPGTLLNLIDSDLWNETPVAVAELLDLGREYERVRRKVMARFAEKILSPALLSIGKEFRESVAVGFRRFFLPRYWKHRRELHKLLLPTQTDREDALLVEWLQEAAECAELSSSIEERSEAGGTFFGERWGGPASEWADLRAFADWVVEFRRYALKGFYEQSAYSLGANAEASSEGHRRLNRKLTRSIEAAVVSLEKLAEVGLCEEDAGLGTEDSADLTDLQDRLEEIAQNLDSIRDYAAYRSALDDLESDQSREFFDAVIEGQLRPKDIEPAFRRRFYECWLDNVFSRRAALGEFRSADHDALLETFRELDGQSKLDARARAGAARLTRIRNLQISGPSDQLRLIQREVRKRSRLLPVRRLLRLAGDAIKVVNPCFMMSPLSVAQFLDPQSIQFDLVVFDEASQITPPDAIGAIVRGKQVVVVGDSNQLPPTNFFGAQIGEDDGTDGDEELELLSDLESILDEVAVAGVSRSRLKWHYRSQHESLIRFSNEEFYHDDPLHIFPSAHRGKDDAGLQFEYVKEGTYEGKGVNSAEARRVAQAVVQHIRDYPEETLGVGTFGVAQQHRILDELDRLRREDPSIEWFFAREGEKKFFVKNLENIQGDDRDVIFLSVTYGPDASGVIRRNFGPINREGGWRRLNVLTTRAKRRMRVFSSMRADEIDVSDVNRGAALMRQYLHYAETGEYQSPRISQGDADTPFETEVGDALRARGYQIVNQVGEAGYRIDIGVIDPKRPGRYLCGIECDGASYHSAATVRDRDRLRQQVLEDRGWTIHRVWSTDWFHNADGQIDRLVGLIENTNEESPEPHPRDEVLHTSSIEDSEALPVVDECAAPNSPQPRQLHAEVVPYKYAKPDAEYRPDQFDSARSTTINQAILQVARVEGPVHIEVLIRRVASFWQKRAGRKIRDRLASAVQVLLGSKKLAKEGEFVWLAGEARILVRSRDIPGEAFPAREIPPLEIEAAIRLLLHADSPLMADDLVAGTARVLGFARTGSELRGVISAVRDRMIHSGALRLVARGLELAD